MGSYGCTKSHYDILSHCIEQQFNSVLIFEDDAIPSCSKLDDIYNLFMAEVPDDWEWLYFGGSLCHKPATRITDHVYRPIGVLNAHAYALRGKMIETVRDALFDEERYKGIVHYVDQMYLKYHRDNNPLPGLYCPHRWMFDQRAGMSDNDGVHKGRQKWKDPCES